MTHTPAPWKVIETWRFDHAGNQRDALVIVNDDSNADVLSGTNAEANAHLIAAAPVMLKGLRRAEQTVRNLASELEGDAKQIAENEAANLRDDIAKAEGDNNG